MDAEHWGMNILLGRFITDEDGATAIEYGLIAAMISVAIIGALGLVNEEMIEMYNYIGDHINEALTR